MPPLLRVGLVIALLGVVGGVAAGVTAQTAPPIPPPRSTEAPPTPADILRGEYGRYRANNDVLSYRLDVRVDPATKSITGTNTIRFRMLSDDTRIQLELHPDLGVDRILLDTTPLKY